MYRGRDTRLNRDVAVKVLPAAFATDPERLQRFEQEARAAAALNHPNILAVYDIGQHDGAPFIVSELLEGETLRERLQGGAPAVRKAIEYAAQIAHGLAAAHEKGVVHRDLKPENVFVTADGRIKIFDFGLAKLTQVEPALGGLSVLPTAAPDTLPGMVLGTIGYMAPEQVRGQAADHRSDVFALGTILYEMLAGRRAFRGDTAIDTMTAILKEDPQDLPVAERHIPPALDRITGRCLEKHPAARFQSTRDLAFALESLSADSESHGVPAAVGRSGRPYVLAAGAAVGAMAIAVLWYGGIRSEPDAQAGRVYHTSLLPSPGVAFDNLSNRMALSPDGRMLAFVAREADGRERLWVRSLDSSSPGRPLNGTEGAFGPFWSPDSRFLGFFAAGQLKRIDATGGSPLVVCPVRGIASGTWHEETIYFSSLNSPIQRVPVSGGTPSAVTTLDAMTGEVAHQAPVVLPGGRRLLFAALGKGGETLGVFAWTLESGERKLIVRGGAGAKYADGHLAFLRERTLMAQSFDPDRLELNGSPTAIADAVRLGTAPLSDFGAFVLSDASTLVYQPDTVTRSRLTWFDRSGTAVGLLGDEADYSDLKLSPDGTRVAASILDPARRASDVWLYDVGRGVATRFTSDPADDIAPVWSPDRSSIALASRRSGQLSMYRLPVSGAGGEETLVEDRQRNIYPYSWSPDGLYIVYTLGTTGSETATNDIWVLPLSGDRMPRPFLQTAFQETRPQFSPDGRWLAYSSNETGRLEVYVTPFPGPGGKVRVSTEGGTHPRWRRDGREVFFLLNADPATTLMAAALRPQADGLQVGDIQKLFDVQLGRPAVSGYVGYMFDVSPDGQRFLVNAAVGDETAASAISLVINWAAALPR